MTITNQLSNYVRNCSECLQILGPKWITLIGFVIQNVFLILVLRAAAIVSTMKADEYLPSTVVLFTEMVKLVLSTTMSFYFDAGGKWNAFLDIIMVGFLDNGLDLLKLCLPAILYAIQNNLQYIIEERPLFMVLYQAKLVTTAVFFSIMLSKRLSIKEWVSIILLAMGVSLVESSQHEISPHHASNILGMLAVALACTTSGFAGVYYEKVLKSSNSSIWVLNMQLSMMSFSFCSIIAMTENPEELIRYGFFKGFNIYVAVIIVLQAMTGLGVALVVKYSDNLYKGFCTSIAIIIAGLLDSVLFQYTEINSSFLMGSGLVVVASTVFYSISHTSQPSVGVHVGSINGPNLPMSVVTGHDQ